MSPKSLNEFSLLEARAGLRAKKFSSGELTRACLDRIRLCDPDIHAYLNLNDRAKEEADRADINLPLGGIPVAVKDNFLTLGLKTTASSNVLENYVPQYDSTVVKKMKNAGAIILGKTNMDAWAHGSSTETSDFGPTKNPWNTGYLPGGSSGGSAAAVAADMCIAAVGSETAGSIRQPASWCGVTGFKPTYGRVSRYGLIAMASSTDSPGPLTKTAADAAYLTGILAGRDPFDATTSPLPVPGYDQEIDKPLPKLKIGIPAEYINTLVSGEVKDLILSAVKVLEKSGAIVEETSLIDPRYAVGVYTILQRSEVSSNLGRFDGIRYGRDRSYFGAEAKRRIMLGTYALSAGYYDHYYKRAQQVRSLIIADFTRAFQKFDLLINPSTPGPALPLHATDNQPMFGEIQDILVEPSSIAGLTGISLPCGFVNGLPVGFGFIAPRFQESLVLQVANYYQNQTAWHHEKPHLAVV